MSLDCALAAGTGPPRILEPDNRTRFSFFSEVKGDHRLVLSAVETVVLALIFAVSLLGNVGALVLVARRRRRGTTACLVLNLFCADLLFTSAIPLVLAVRWTEAWMLGPVACHLLLYVMSLSGSVTILTLAAVSLERVVCIVRLQRGVRGPGPRARAALLALIWGYSALAALPLCVFFHVLPQRLPGSEQVSRAAVGAGRRAGIRRELSPGMKVNSSEKRPLAALNHCVRPCARRYGVYPLNFTATARCGSRKRPPKCCKWGPPNACNMHRLFIAKLMK